MSDTFMGMTWGFIITTLIGIGILSVISFGIVYKIYMIISNIMQDTLQRISNDVTTQMFMMSNLGMPSDERNLRTSPTQLYRTMDGKYEASSLQELIKKVLSDKNSPYSEEELDALGNFFNKIEGTGEEDTENPEGFR